MKTYRKSAILGMMIICLLISAFFLLSATPITYAEPGARFWIHVTEEPAGARIQFKRKGDTEWTDVDVGDKWEYSRDDHIFMRNIGATKTGMVEDLGSSTGDPSNIDRHVAVEGLKPVKDGVTTEVEKWPGILEVISGTVIGTIKGALDIVGGLFSIFGGKSTANASLTNPDHYVGLETTVTTEVKSLLLTSYGDFTIDINSATDPTVRHLTHSGEYIIYDLEGNFVEHGGVVGGIWVPVDKFALLAPYIGLVSTIVAATVATAIYAKRVKRRKEK